MFEGRCDVLYIHGSSTRSYIPIRQLCVTLPVPVQTGAETYWPYQDGSCGSLICSTKQAISKDHKTHKTGKPQAAAALACVMQCQSLVGRDRYCSNYVRRDM